MTLAEIKLWGRTIGAISWSKNEHLGYFEYDSEFISSDIQVSPIKMPLSKQIYAFPDLAKNTFHGLPGLLADSLPDKFGNMLINTWLAKNGRTPESFNPVERLCYIGTRGMGALEFKPTLSHLNKKSTKIKVGALVELASKILTQREAFDSSFSQSNRESDLQDILKVGTSAGGARAKAIIAWNQNSNEVRSGQLSHEKGFSYWLLKFDGVSGNKDKELDDAQGFGKIEYAYHLMAIEAGIKMTECRLLKENGRNHFMTKRFDRNDAGEKLHMQSLSGIAHFDFNMSGSYSYEQAITIIRQLKFPMSSIEEMFRRMAFNIIARNQDDHPKNIAFLMNKQGHWGLAPAYDLTYSYNPDGLWTSTHQMSLNGKKDGFDKSDFIQCAKNGSMKRGRTEQILEEVKLTVSKWEDFAHQAGVPNKIATQIKRTHRMDI